jgi:hypothetical protein
VPNLSISPQAQSWHGQAHLIYHKQGSKTVPRVQTQAPLKVQQPFYPEGPQTCHTVLLHTAGGMVGGDRLSIDITLDADTEALVTTAAAAKIYSDHPQQLPAQIQGHVQVGAGACLEWFPQETIVFEGAHYHPLGKSIWPQARLGWVGIFCDWGARLAESDSPRGASARTLAFFKISGLSGLIPKRSRAVRPYGLAHKL